MAYRTFFVDLQVPRPEPEQLTFRFQVTEVGRNRMGEAYVNLQLVLKPGELLETAHARILLGENPVHLAPEQIGGWIRHAGWTLKVPPTARLTWPVLPYNPYRAGPETELRYAVGRLWVPIEVGPQPDWALNWRRQTLEFTLAATLGVTD